jgi:hypothetical protein
MSRVGSALRRSRSRRRAGLERTARIFGIGLSRTATTSLTSAISRLGFRAVHFPADDRSRAQVMSFLANRAATLRLTILDQVDAITDTPVAATFPALDAAYPGSKFILTVRERGPWLESCRAYWTDRVERFARDRPDDPWTHYIEALSGDLYGGTRFDRGRFVAAYEAHSERVRAHFQDRPDDLLVIDICAGEGWEPLCGFLNQSPPAEAFPWDYQRRAER